MGMVFPVSTHNYELRYWLAAGGLNPGFYLPGDVAGTTGAEVQLSVTPPPQMPATLEAGTIDGYSVGEPWNQAAVAKKIGVPVIIDPEIWKDNPDKVFGLTRGFRREEPEDHARAAGADPRRDLARCRTAKNRHEGGQDPGAPEYVGADKEVIANSMTGKFTFEQGDTRAVPGLQPLLRPARRAIRSIPTPSGI